MKPPKDPMSYMDEIKEAQAEGVANIDLDGIDLPAQLYRDMEALGKAGKNKEAKELYVSSVIDAAVATEEKELIVDWGKPKLRKGGKIRGKQKTEDANIIKKWLYPLLAECEAELPIKKKNKGWVTMYNSVIRKVTKEDLDDPRKKYLTRARIQAWIDEGRPKNLST